MNQLELIRQRQKQQRKSLESRPALIQKKIHKEIQLDENSLPVEQSKKVNPRVTDPPPKPFKRLQSQQEDVQFWQALTVGLQNVQFQGILEDSEDENVDGEDGQDVDDGCLLEPELESQTRKRRLSDTEAEQFIPQQQVVKIAPLMLKAPSLNQPQIRASNNNNTVKANQVELQFDLTRLNFNLLSSIYVKSKKPLDINCKEMKSFYFDGIPCYNLFSQSSNAKQAWIDCWNCIKLKMSVTESYTVYVLHPEVTVLITPDLSIIYPANAFLIQSLLGLQEFLAIEVVQKGLVRVRRSRQECNDIPKLTNKFKVDIQDFALMSSFVEMLVDTGRSTSFYSNKVDPGLPHLVSSFEFVGCCVLQPSVELPTLLQQPDGSTVYNMRVNGPLLPHHTNAVLKQLIKADCSVTMHKQKQNRGSVGFVHSHQELELDTQSKMSVQIRNQKQC